MSDKHKAARLKWAKKHQDWTFYNWSHVIWTDEALFKTDLDIRSCYVTRCKGTAIESRYLKPTFKSKRSSVGIWKAIVLRLKGPVHFLEKKSRMNLDIFINKVLEGLKLPFYNQCIMKKGSIIWIDDGACYYTSKMTTVYCCYIRLICMDWLA